MELLNTAEAAERLGVSARRVLALITEGKLSAQRVGRDYVINADDLATVKTYGKSGRPPKDPAPPPPAKKARAKKGAK